MKSIWTNASCSFMNQRCQDGHLKHARTPQRNQSPKLRGGESVIMGFSRRRSNNSRTSTKKSIAISAAHQLGLWICADKSTLNLVQSKASCCFLQVVVTCLAEPLALPEMSFVAPKDAFRNIITICRSAQSNRGFSIPFCLTSTNIHSSN